MLHKSKLLALAVLATSTFAGCKKPDAPPATECYSGRVVAATCVDGVLIEVDPAYAVGAPAFAPTEHGNVLLGRNVIAVVNSQALNSMGRPGAPGNLSSIGQRLYFNTAADGPGWSGPRCNAADGMRGNFPHVALTDISTTGCQEYAPFCGTR